MISRQLFENMSVHIYYSHYIAGDQWWLDKDGKNWWNRKDHFAYDAIYLSTVGEFELTVNGVKHRILPGQLVFIPAGSDLEYFFDGIGSLEKHYVHFDLTFGGRRLADYFSIPVVSRPEDPSAISALFSELHLCFSRRQEAADCIRANGLLLELVFELLKHSDAKMIYNDDALDRKMREIYSYMEAHCGENPSVGDLAERVGYSAAHFTKKFKQAFGCTPSEYMSSMKIDRARRLLLTTNRSISAIATELGFCDASYFSNYFRSRTGLFPSVFRHQSKG